MIYLMNPVIMCNVFADYLRESCSDVHSFLPRRPKAKSNRKSKARAKESKAPKTTTAAVPSAHVQAVYSCRSHSADYSYRATLKLIFIHHNTTTASWHRTDINLTGKADMNGTSIIIYSMMSKQILLDVSHVHDAKFTLTFYAIRHSQ